MKQSKNPVSAQEMGFFIARGAGFKVQSPIMNARIVIHFLSGQDRKDGTTG
jgi:hypothetical protein